MSLRLWKCYDGTYDIVDDEGTVVYQNVPIGAIALGDTEVRDPSRASDYQEAVISRAVKDHAFALALAAEYVSEIERLTKRLAEVQTCPNCGLQYTAYEGEELRSRLAEAEALLIVARAEVEWWTPDVCNATDHETSRLRTWYTMRDKIDAFLGGEKP